MVRKNNNISRRLIVMVIGFSSLLTFVFTSIQLALDYRQQRADLDAILLQAAVYVPTLSNSVWTFDKTQIELGMRALSELPGIERVAVVTSDNKHFVRGEVRSKQLVTKTYPLEYTSSDGLQKIGELTVTGNLESIYYRVLEHALSILLSNALKTAAVAIFMFFLLRNMVTARLQRLGESIAALDQINARHQSVPLVQIAERKDVQTASSAASAASAASAQTDEIDQLQGILSSVGQRLDRALSGLHQEISARTEVERQLLESQQNLENLVALRTQELLALLGETNLILNNASIGICKVFLREGGRELRMANRAMEAMLAYERGELEGMDVRSLYFSGDNYDALGHVYATLATGQVYFGESELCGKDKRRVIVAQTASAIDPNDLTKGTIWLTENITARRGIEQELVEANILATASNKAKGEFLANMSHEIRTPMNAIIGLTRIVQKTELSAQQHDYLQKIYSSSQHLLGILNDILDFSKIESQKLEIEHEGFSLTSVLENLSSLIGTKASEKGLEFLFDIDTGVPDLLVGDALRLGQILINYSNNAIKFTESGEVCVRVKPLRREQDKIFLRFEVKDTGVGLTQEQIQRLFQSFSQADASTTRRYGGTGLGLVISKTLAELMQGEVGVESEPGKGSVFWFTAWLGISEQQTLSTETIKDLRVLVVDDNASAREILTHMLQGWQCEASSVDGGLASIQAVQAVDQSTQPYDLVLMDWQMPDLDGIEAIRRIQALQLTHPPKVVMVTAFGRSDVLQACNDVKVQEVLSKPINPSMLYNTLMRSMDAQQVVQQVKDLSQSRDAQYGVALQRIAGARILLVEDNDLNQLVATELLRSEGFVVEVADNGQIAVDKVRAEDAHWDLVLMDMQMPVMDGISATLEIRKTISAGVLPIVAMTANAMNEDRDRCLASGMQGFVRKPIEPAELWEALCAWIAPRQVPAPTSPPSHTSDLAVANGHAWFFGISGLDAKLGLSRVRDKVDLFENMLRRFVAGQARVADEIRDALQTGDVATARRLAHTLKAVAGTIGASELQNLASAMENHLARSEVDLALAGIDDLANSLRQLLSGLQIALNAKMASHVDSTVREFDAEEFKRVTRELLTYIESDDGEAVHCLQKHAGLLRAGWGDDFELVKNLLDGFEFEAVKAVIEATIQKRH